MVAFLSVGAVCASDINETDNTITTADDNVVMQINESDLASGNDDVLMAENDCGELIGSNDNAADENAGDSKPKGASFKINSNQIYLKHSKFHIKVLDANKKRIVNKTVQVTFKDKTYNLTTNQYGKVYFKLKSKGNYKISYSFNEPGYTPIKGSKNISIVGNKESAIAYKSYYVAYERFKNPYTVNLTVGGVRLPNQKVILKINGTFYTKKTDSNGQATFNIKYPNGTYKIKCIYRGTTNAKFVKAYAKIKVKKEMPTKIVKLNSPVFKNNVKTAIKFKYLDARGNPIYKKTIVLKIKNTKYKKTTDKNGIVKFKIKLPVGNYKLRVFSYDTIYKHSYNQYYIKVEPIYNNGFWLFGADMMSVDLKSMADNGINNIFLNFYAVELHGKSAVEDFATQAKSLGINVHIWMQAFYKGGWILPVDNSGNLKYSLYDSIIEEAKEYASINGVAGIHFDYLRFSGTAYKYEKGVEAINYFTKKACEELHKQNPNLVLSAAVMPEPSGMKYYYGQDISTISQYLDVIVPMIYKGNYGQGTSWITSTTEKFVEMSNGAEIWTGIQSYYADSDTKSLPVSELKKDSRAGLNGGANGVILFRYGLFNLFDFNTV